MLVIWYLNYVCHLRSLSLFCSFPIIPSSFHSCITFKLHILLYEVHLKQELQIFRLPRILAIFDCRPVTEASQPISLYLPAFEQ